MAIVDDGFGTVSIINHELTLGSVIALSQAAARQKRHPIAWSLTLLNAVEGPVGLAFDGVVKTGGFLNAFHQAWVVDNGFIRMPNPAQLIQLVGGIGSAGSGMVVSGHLNYLLTNHV